MGGRQRTSLFMDIEKKTAPESKQEKSKSKKKKKR